MEAAHERTFTANTSRSMRLDILPFSLDFTNARATRFQQRPPLAARSRHRPVQTRSSRLRSSTKLGGRIPSSRRTPSFSQNQSHRLSTNLPRRRSSPGSTAGLCRSRLLLTLFAASGKQARDSLRWPDLVGEESETAHRGIPWTRNCRCDDRSTSLSTCLYVRVSTKLNRQSLTHFACFISRWRWPSKSRSRSVM